MSAHSMNTHCSKLNSSQCLSNSLLHHDSLSSNSSVNDTLREAQNQEPKCSKLSFGINRLLADVHQQPSVKCVQQNSPKEWQIQNVNKSETSSDQTGDSRSFNEEPLKTDNRLRYHPSNLIQPNPFSWVNLQISSLLMAKDGLSGKF